jgi:hypothetical protein
VGNPEGFKSSHAMVVGSIHMLLDRSSLFEETEIVDKIELIDPEIIYEKVGGTDKLKIILKNLKKGESLKRLQRMSLEKKVQEQNY